MINLLVLRCHDLTVSQAFYESLGMTFKWEQHGDGPRHLAHVGAGYVLELYPWSGVDTRGLRIGLSVSSLPDAVAKLRSAGVVTGEVLGEEIMVRDPDGHSIVLTER